MPRRPPSCARASPSSSSSWHEKAPIADSADGQKAAELLQKLNVFRYAAYFCGVLSLLLGLALGYLYYRPAAEPDSGASEPVTASDHVSGRRIHPADDRNVEDMPRWTLRAALILGLVLILLAGSSGGPRNAGPPALDFPPLRRGGKGGWPEPSAGQASPIFARGRRLQRSRIPRRGTHPVDLQGSRPPPPAPPSKGGKVRARLSLDVWRSKALEPGPALEVALQTEIPRPPAQTLPPSRRAG